MSEKINEDNCILDEDELFTIGNAFGWVEQNTVDKDGAYRKELEKIIQKITKLNDLAKDRTNEQ
jgi:hypothetical protein